MKAYIKIEKLIKFVGIKIELATKMLKKLDLYVYFSQKWLDIYKGFDETKFMSSLIKDNALSEKYNEIWEKIKDSLKKESDTELVHNKKK